MCACDQCGEVFPKIESLQLHQAVRHAGIILILIFVFFPLRPKNTITLIQFIVSHLLRDPVYTLFEKILTQNFL